MAKTNLKIASARDPARDALAAAIDDEAVARKNLDDARSAADKARGLVWSSEDRLTALREAAANERPADAIVAALAAGQLDVAVLDRPQAESSAKLEGAEQEVSAWRRAREAADTEIAPREEALEKAQRRVKQAVAEVMRTVDVGALLEAAERTQERLVAERARLLQLRALLPSFSAEQRAIDSFLARPILAHENGTHGAIIPQSIHGARQLTGCIATRTRRCPQSRLNQPL